MSKKIFSVFFLLIILLISSCNYEPESYGDFEKIYIFADSTNYNKVRPELEQVFDHFVYTPHSERSYYLEYQPLKELNAYNKRRNLLFLAVLDGKDEVSKYISQILSPEVQESIRNDKVFYIFRENLFTQDQMTIILIGKDIVTMRNNLTKFSDDIFNQLDAYHFKRLDRIMFIKGEQIALEEYLWENLGWKIKIQHDYHIVKETEDGNFVWVRRFKPDRNIYIYRFKGDSTDLNENNILNIRDSLGVVYFEGDNVSREDTYARFEPFKERYAMTLTGVWQNHNHYIGGPFKIYAIYDDRSETIYMIDMVVTAPGKRKKPFIDQLDVMARSFTIN